MRIGNKKTKNMSHQINLLTKRIGRLVKRYGGGHAYVHAAQKRMKLLLQAAG